MRCCLRLRKYWCSPWQDNTSDSFTRVEPAAVCHLPPSPPPPHPDTWYYKGHKCSEWVMRSWDSLAHVTNLTSREDGKSNRRMRWSRLPMEMLVSPPPRQEIRHEACHHHPSAASCLMAPQWPGCSNALDGSMTRWVCFLFNQHLFYSQTATNQVPGTSRNNQCPLQTDPQGNLLRGYSTERKIKLKKNKPFSTSKLTGRQ